LGNRLWVSSSLDNSIYGGSVCIRALSFFQTVAANRHTENKSCFGGFPASDTFAGLAIIFARFSELLENFFLGVLSEIWHFVFSSYNSVGKQVFKPFGQKQL